MRFRDSFNFGFKLDLFRIYLLAYCLITNELHLQIHHGTYFNMELDYLFTYNLFVQYTATQINYYECVCIQGFTGPVCQHKLPHTCMPMPCLNNAQCVHIGLVRIQFTRVNTGE